MAKFATAFALGMIAQVAQAEKCYVLALSSGEESAAYQAGAIKGLAETLDMNNRSYDAVSGVQGGAVNAVLFSSFEKGDEVAAADRLKTFWDNAANSQLYKSWKAGIVQGFLWEGGLYNSEPIGDFLREEFAGISHYKRDVDIGITDVLTGKFKGLEGYELTDDNLVEALHASLSVAGFFPPLEAFGSDYFDGSAVWDIDIFTPVNRCLEKTTEDEVVIDVILTSTANLKEVDASDFHTINMLFRYLEVSSYYGSMDGYLRAQFAYPNATFRYLISPSGSLPSSRKPMDLSQEDIDGMIAMGEVDAKTAILYPDNTEAMLQFHSMKKTGDNRISGMDYKEFTEKKQAGEFESYSVKSDPRNKVYEFLQ